MARKVNTIWNIKVRNDYARSGYFTDGGARIHNHQVDNYPYYSDYDEFAGYNQAASYGSNQYYDNWGNYEQPGYSGISNQIHQQQFFSWEDQGQGQFFGVSTVAFSNQNGRYPQNYYSQDYNRYHPVARRTRWDAPMKDNRIVPYNNARPRDAPMKDNRIVPYNNARPRSRQIECYDCGRLLPNYGALYEHKKQHKRNYYCTICNRCSTSYADFKRHEATHTIQACQKCPEIFKYKESLTAHMKHAHPVQLAVVTEGKSGTEVDQGAASQSISSVPEEHSKDNVEHKPSFSEPAAASTPHAEKKNKTETSDNDSGVKTESFQCPHCIKSFESENQMYSHCKIHTEADPGAVDSLLADEKPVATLPCPFCIKTFPSRREVCIHMSSVHTQIFYCLKCPAEFATQTELNAHEEKVHK